MTIPMSYDLRPLANWITTSFEREVRVGADAGCYARRRSEDFPHLYGITDMACVFYALGYWPPEERARTEWCQQLQSLQEPDTGYCRAIPADHGILHNTAFTLAAMNLLGMLPGFGNIKKQLQATEIDDTFFKHAEAIVFSMTPKERRNPDLINGSRRKRIADGSGTTPQDVNQLLKQWRIAIVVSAIAAALITPTVDPVNMSLLMAPLIVLYLLSVLFAKLAT
jgi:hypothetical protein